MNRSQEPEFRPESLSRKLMARDFGLAGTICFWSQFLLTLIAGLIILTALFRRSFDLSQVAPNRARV